MLNFQQSYVKALTSMSLGRGIHVCSEETGKGTLRILHVLLTEIWFVMIGSFYEIKISFSPNCKMF